MEYNSLQPLRELHQIKRPHENKTLRYGMILALCAFVVLFIIGSIMWWKFLPPMVKFMYAVLIGTIVVIPQMFLFTGDAGDQG